MATMHEWLNRLRKPRGPQPPSKQDSLIEQLREVRRQLDGVESYFALENDEDLLDAAIYHREALEARHRHLLRLAREGNAVAAQPPILEEARERWIH
ncbi:MAG: DUF2508 family protein [Oscillospiraceae bacterium]|nr:DUF2508 family protein [Oscillospiraceae bacterium]